MTGISKLSDSLDFNKVLTEDRLELVGKIIQDNENYLVNYYSDNYNPHVNQEGMLSENSRIGKDLEALATYLLYAKDGEAQEDTITDYRKKRNTTREASIEKLMKVNDFKRSENSKSIIKIPKIKVNAEDRIQHRELKASGEVISRLTKMIKERVNSSGEQISEKEVRKLKWIRTDIQKDEIAIKTELKKYVQFNSVTRSEKDLTSLSHIRFDDIEIMRILIEDYAELKKQSQEDTHGYMKIILISFDEIIRDSHLESYLLDILSWKIENLQHNEIIDKLQEKYDMKVTKPKLSKITREILPSIFVETYKKQKEDWLYTYLMKGEYKCCSSCKVNYLATIKYFNPDKTAKSGLRSMCKKCRKEKYKEQSTAKK